MDKNAFLLAAPGRVVDLPDGTPSFIPDALPPKFSMDNSLWKAEVEASKAVARVEVVLPSAELDPFLVTYALIDREAFCTSRLEGTYTTPADLVLFDLDDKSDDSASSLSTREAVNYRTAVRNCVQALRGGKSPISHALLRAAHEELLSETRGENKHPGQYRTEQNYIGSNRRFVPPPASEMRVGMDALVQWMSDCSKPDQPFPNMTSIAIAHYQFETLHPFEDGNGRIGRLLVPLLLIHAGLMKEPLLHISATIERRKTEYTDLMLAVSQRGEWAGWVRFFLEVLVESARETMSLTTKLKELRDDFERRIVKPKRSVALARIARSLVQHPGLRIADAAKIGGVQFPQASEHVETLVRLKILRETTGGKRNRRYVCDEVLNAVFGPI